MVPVLSRLFRAPILRAQGVLVDLVTNWRSHLATGKGARRIRSPSYTQSNNDAEGNVARMALLGRAATVMARFLENRRGKLTATAHLQVAIGIPINLAIVVGQPGK
jgi:hypothetical protein